MSDSEVSLGCPKRPAETSEPILQHVATVVLWRRADGSFDVVVQRDTHLTLEGHTTVGAALHRAAEIVCQPGERVRLGAEDVP